ncbi:transposable element tc3 transposase [Nephila pilipes]|uniref:Transposable element tc3 transposase n=1 Tax=Nephila pilipes TaxID=299642 RepID=A0A8X6QV65_NEPPI|nr:transposable element tc3 transposase [Nephila pilipes]
MDRGLGITDFEGLKTTPYRSITGQPNVSENVDVIGESTMYGMVHREQIDRIIGPFFFTENTVNGGIFLDMLQLFALSQLEDLQPNFWFQQDGAPLHWLKAVRDHLDEIFHSRWIGWMRCYSIPGRKLNTDWMCFEPYMKNILRCTYEKKKKKNRIRCCIRTDRQNNRM